MPDTWPPPLPTYTNDIAANVVNSIGWTFEALNPLSWVGLNAVQPLGMGTANANNQRGSPVQVKQYSALDQILLSTPFTAPLAGQVNPTQTRADPATVSIAVVALPVLAAALIAGWLVWKGR